MKHNNNKKISYIVMGLTLSAGLLFVEQASAAIFKCTSANGTVFYNDKPCPKKDSETEMRAIKDPLNTRKMSKGMGAKKKPFADESKTTKVVKKDTVKVTTPASSEPSTKKKKADSSSNQSTVLQSNSQRTNEELAVSAEIEKHAEQRLDRPKTIESSVAGSDELERLMKINDNHTKNELARSSPR